MSARERQLTERMMQLNAPIEWKPLTPLRGSTAKLLPFPVNALPPIIREMAKGISETTCSDVAMAGTALLSSLSYCLSGQYRIVGKKDHSEPLVLDSLIVADASFMKSPVMKLIAQPYNDFVDEYNEKNKVKINENRARRKILTAKLSAIKG